MSMAEAAEEKEGQERERKRVAGIMRPSKFAKLQHLKQVIATSILSARIKAAAQKR